MVNEISKQPLSLVATTNVATDIENKPVDPAALQQQQEPDILQEDNQTSIETIVESTANRLNNVVQSVERDLEFTVDEKSGDTIITVLDRKTNEVIRQIPSEEVLAIRENIESLKGILFSAEV